MNQAAHLPGSPWLDDNWRLAWIAPLAIALWIVLLAVFADLLGRTAAPPPISAVEARLIELPPATPVAGLQSGAPQKAAPAPPRPVVRKATPHVVHHHVRVHHVLPLPPPSTEGMAKPVPESAPSSAAPLARAPEANTATSGSPGRESDANASGGLGGGTDSSGARAIFSPQPEIPDELRENALVAVAIAHFEIGSDGQAKVTLSQPTANPELNDLLLDTLRRWRFAPATRSGIAVESAFDIRIPVTIQ